MLVLTSTSVDWLAGTLDWTFGAAEPETEPFEPPPDEHPTASESSRNAAPDLCKIDFEIIERIPWDVEAATAPFRHQDSWRGDVVGRRLHVSCREPIRPTGRSPVSKCIGS